MLLRLKIFRWAQPEIILSMLGVLLVLVCVPQAQAQEEDLFGSTEDDSLLFGDEFDIGGDDFSFDFEEDIETSPEDAESDDLFGEETEEMTDTTAVEDDWGFGDESESDDAFGTDSTDVDITEIEYSDHPMDFRKKFQGTFMEGAGVTFSFSSPQYVAEKMDTWYSFMDVSVSVELPWHLDYEPASVSFLVESSSFKFENSFPAGGAFKGMTLMPLVRAEAYGFEAEAGLGAYFPTFGMMTGLGYAYQYHSLFFSGGYRWNWAYKIDTIGSGWWVEPRFTVGFKLW